MRLPSRDRGAQPGGKTLVVSRRFRDERMDDDEPVKGSAGTAKSY